MQALILDLWEKKTGGLENWIKSGPSFRTIMELATGIEAQHVAKFGQLDSNMDSVLYNQSMMCRDFLLYAEKAHSMKIGDIGHVIDCLYAFIPIWKGTSKHNYVNMMHKFLINLEHHWPALLCTAIKTNWLCNPTGKEFGWRGVDWLIELNNFYTKVIFGGHGSNCAVKLILQTSNLIEVLQQCHANFD